MKTKDLVLTGLFAAGTAILAQVILPLPGIAAPVSLALMIPMVAGRLAGRKIATISQVLYLALGCIGLPVFSGFKGGPGVLFSAGGGYLIGYIVTALICGIKSREKNKGFLVNLGVSALGTLGCYAVGLVWFMIVTGSGFFSALALCILPFIPGDVLKILLGMYIIKKLQPIRKIWA